MGRNRLILVGVCEQAGRAARGNQVGIERCGRYDPFGVGSAHVQIERYYGGEHGGNAGGGFGSGGAVVSIVFASGARWCWIVWIG